jgi:hypothetical protein
LGADLAQFVLSPKPNELAALLDECCRVHAHTSLILP